MLPKESAQFIFANADYVHINLEHLDNLCSEISNEFLNGKYSLKTWKEHDLNPKIMNESAISWIFFIDTINFSFWSDSKDSKFTVLYNDKSYTGYWSICAAVNRAIDNGIDVTNANYMKNMTMKQFNEIFYSNNNDMIPLASERVAALNEAGNVLIDKFGGHFVNCVIQSKGSAQNLLNLIVENFSSYQDRCLYKEQLVCLYKRAQILIADIWCCFENEGFGQFIDIDRLTAFADYRVPQVLAYFRALEYSDELQKHLENKQLLDNGDPREVEIRGVTLQCIEIMVNKIKAVLQSKDICVNSILVDNYLWDYRRKFEESIDAIPMHRTRTVYY